MSNHFNFSGFGSIRPKQCWLVLLIMFTLFSTSTAYAQLCDNVLLDPESSPEEWFDSFRQALSVGQYKSLRSFFFLDILADQKQSDLLCNTSEPMDLTQNWTASIKDIQGNFCGFKIKYLIKCLWLLLW